MTTTFFIIAILVLGFLITFQIAKASEYVAVIRGEEKSRKQTNKINAFLLLVFLILFALLSYFADWVAVHFSDALNIVFRILDLGVSLGVVAVLFAAIFKFLPDAEVRWQDVRVGALMTAVLFVLAKFALGYYFGHSDPASTYGAAGSIVLVMLWVTYSGLILLFGAEFTRIYADRYGEEIRPSEFAVSTRHSQDPKDKHVDFQSRMEHHDPS